MNKLLTRFECALENYVLSDINIIWFRRCVYTLLLLKMVAIWPELPMFYRHIVSMGKGSLLPQELMFMPIFHDHYTICWIVASCIVTLGIVCKSRVWLSVMVFVVSLNYLMLAYKAINFGDMLLNFLVLMLIFMREGAKKFSVRQMITNAAVLIVQLHFCILYFVNAYGKIELSFWRDGTFFNDIWQLSYYANPHLPAWFHSPSLNFLTAWSVMIFEFLFPVLIWFKRFKKPLLIIGLLFHFAIAVMLSLPDFGLTMAVVYILFFDFKQNRRSKSIATTI